jgi:hypothetical protein
MGDKRFTDRDSLHLTAPGWQVLGLIFHDLEYGIRQELSEPKKQAVLDKMAAIDWSRHNQDWVPMLGEAELDRDGNPVLNAAGNKRVALSRAGRTTIAILLKYVREKTGLDVLVGQEPEAEETENIQAP